MTRTHENSLRTYLLTRIALAVPTVLILLTMVFLLMRVAPGNPIQAALGGHVPQAQIRRGSIVPATTARS
jgi:peptide/nickel transport system permease protein